MDEKKNILPLDLQFFAEGEQGGNPTPNNENQQEPTPNANLEVHQEEGKKFSQDDLNRINIKGKQDELRRILKATGFESEELLLKHLEKVKNYDDIFKENTSYKAQAIKNGYLGEINKNQVADEYVETIYLALPPTENEKVEDYNVRVKEYLNTHKAFLKQNPTPRYVDVNNGPNQINRGAEKPMSLREAIQMEYGK